MSTPVHSSADRRRIALTVMVVLAGASALLTLTDLQVGPAWMHWIGSAIALTAALGVVVIAELNWQRAVSAAKAAGLVSRSRPTLDGDEVPSRG